MRAIVYRIRVSRHARTWMVFASIVVRSNNTAGDDDDQNSITFTYYLLNNCVVVVVSRVRDAGYMHSYDSY